jgi:hypothetical protein
MGNASPPARRPLRAGAGHGRLLSWSSGHQHLPESKAVTSSVRDKSPHRKSQLPQVARLCRKIKTKNAGTNGRVPDTARPVTPPAGEATGGGHIGAGLVVNQVTGFSDGGTIGETF